MKLDMNRRQLLRVAQAFGVTSALGGFPMVAAAAGTVTRRNVTDDAARDDLAAYDRAVGIMKGLPSSDKRNWTVQATIHNGHCTHSNWYFLPWHRAYLKAFEDIIRDVSGKTDFALPYWNWTAQPKIPAPFWTGNLNDTTRRVGPNTDMPASAVSESTLNTRVLNQRNFQAFASYMPKGQDGLDPARWQRATGGTGALEGTPHNTVHGTIGGNMGTYMSPLDPIFWLHHSNVDRLWVVWRNMGNADETNSLWRDFVFPNNFYQPNGMPISPIVRGQLSTEALGYTYDNVGSTKITSQNVDVATGNPLRGQILAQLGAFSAVAGKVGTAHVATQKVRTLAAASSAGKTYVILDGVTPPTEEGVALKVYLNTPKADADTGADISGYVGEVAFFGNHSGMEHGLKTVSFVLDATDAAKSVNRGGNNIQIGVVPYHLDTGKAAAAVPIASTKIVTV